MISWIDPVGRGRCSWTRRLPWGLAIICTLWIGIFPRFTHADEPVTQLVQLDRDRQYAFARSLYVSRRFTRAAAEFERFIFFFPDDTRVPEAQFKVADAYFKAGQYQEAITVCRIVTEKGESSLDTDRFYLLLARCQVKVNQVDQALITLHNLLSITQNPVSRDDARYLGMWIFIENAQWAKARGWLQEISPQSRERYSIDTLTSVLASTDTIPRKHPRMAGLLSIIPGGGHLYTGRYQDALISFLLNTLTFWAAYEAFEEDQPVLGGLLGIVGINFYTGNIYSAINSAHKYNRRTTKTYIEDLKRRTRVQLIMGPDNSGGMQVAIDF